VVNSPRIQWDELRALIDTADVPRTLRLDGTPPINIFYEPATGRLGLQVPLGATEVPVSPLVQLEIEKRNLDGKNVAEISTNSQPLYPYFHGFAISVADRVQKDGLDANDAVAECLARWRDLFRQALMLSPERQLGLMGELWLLNRLIITRGSKEALTAWTGPRSEAHDFRLGSLEIEVKATTGEHRIHVISSDTQLVPSPGNRLYLLSLQYASAGSGAGNSLGDLIAGIRSRLVRTSEGQSFDDTMEAAFDLTPHVLPFYNTRYRMRSSPYLVEVGHEFPRINLTDLSDAVDIVRISDVRYRVNVEGLGVEEGTPPFIELLGEAQDAAR
jgi:hypothetical protein